MEYHLRTEVLQGRGWLDGCQEQPVDLTFFT